MAVQAGQPKGWPVTDEAGLLTLFELPPISLSNSSGTLSRLPFIGDGCNEQFSVFLFPSAAALSTSRIYAKVVRGTVPEGTYPGWNNK